MEVLTAAAIIAVTALALSGALVTVSAITQASRAVTRGRLLAQSHLEQAAAGTAPQVLVDGDLVSILTPLDCDGIILWQAEVNGSYLHKSLKVVGRP